LIHQLHAYVPGEQPKIKGLIEFNTNENPYPLSPQVRSSAFTRLVVLLTFERGTPNTRLESPLRST